MGFVTEQNEKMKKYKKAFEYIRSDAYRYVGRCDAWTIVRMYLFSRLFRWHVAFRLMQHVQGGGVIRLLWRFNTMKRSIQISPTMKLGYGLYVAHGGPVVINPSAVIGDNCNLSQFTTIGSNDGKAAHIGNNVYIGPSVCCVEDVKIGDNVTIGAGSVVTKDIPDNATAAGNYARVLNYNNPGRYIGNRWFK